MRVYIASKYIEHRKLNREIYNILVKAGYEVFLPESINIDAISNEEMQQVAEICYDEIEKSDIILAVCPYGKSVASEVGYAIALKRLTYKNNKLIILNMDNLNEAMIDPYVNAYVNSISELISYLREISL